MNRETLHIRKATAKDRRGVEALQRHALQRLSARCYSARQIDRFLKLVGTFDERLIADGTYFVVEDYERLVGCGGWSRRGATFSGRTSGTGAHRIAGGATIRAVYTRPDCARRGIGRAVMVRSEEAALADGHRCLYLSASLAAVPFYRALGYRPLSIGTIALPDGTAMPMIPMAKTLIGTPTGACPGDRSQTPA